MREYYDPSKIVETVGANAIPWFGTRCCVNVTSNSVRRLAKVSIVFVAFLVSIAQWSALASGVSFFQKRVGMDADTANGVTSAALSVCFLFCIGGGALNDGSWGCVRVLLSGLAGAVCAAAVASGLTYPFQGFDSAVAHGFLAASVFVFAGAIGFAQTALTTLVGDQCHHHPSQLASMYNLYYGMIQFGAFIARAGFPLVDYYNWFIGMVCFVMLPVAIALCFFSTHTVGTSPVILAFKVLGRRMCGTVHDELICYYPEKTVRDSFRSARVLRLHVVLPFFWALYFQMFGLWYLQAKKMDLYVVGDQAIVAEQVTVVNPLFDVMCLLLFSGLFWLLRSKCSIRISPLSKIQVGFFFAIGAFVAATILQYNIENSPSQSISIYWQLPQYVMICAAEVLVYPPALHLAYVNSPASMRSFVQSSLWFFIGLGNALNTIIIFVAGSLMKDTDSKLPLYLAYSSIMGLATLVFGILAYYYDEHPADAEDQRFAVNGSFKVGQSRSGSAMITAAGAVRNSYHVPNNTPMSGHGTDGFGTPPFRSTISEGTNPPAGGESQPLLLDPTPDRIYRMRSGSGLSTSSAHGGDAVDPRRVRRLPSPRDPRRGGVTYYSTRKSPRTSTLEQ